MRVKKPKPGVAMYSFHLTRPLRAYSVREGLGQPLLKLIWTAHHCAVWPPLCACSTYIKTYKSQKAAAQESDVWYEAALQYSIEMYWMGWDGPNEAGIATFQATSTGQRRAPPRGSQCCGSGPFLGSGQVSLNTV